MSTQSIDRKEPIYETLQRLQERLNDEHRLMLLTINGLEQRLVLSDNNDSRDKCDAFLAFNLQWKRLEESIFSYTAAASSM